MGRARLDRRERPSRSLSPASWRRALGAAVVLAFSVLAAALLPAAPAQAQTTVWSATLTVDDASAFGCSNSGWPHADNCSTSTVLTDDNFDYGGTTYTIDAIFSGGSDIRLGFSGIAPANAKTALTGLTLTVGTGVTAKNFAIADSAPYTEPFETVSHLRWTGAALRWSDGDTVALKLTAPATKPAKPTGFTATAGNAQVALSWTNPNDATITKYQYQQKAGSAAWGSWTDIVSSAPGETNATSYTVTSLMNGTAYRFRIRAVNAGGNSQQSDRSASVTPAVPPPPPPAQTAVWSATLTVDVSSIYSGCSNSGGYRDSLDDCSTRTVLTDDDFDYAGTTYTIQSITAGDSGFPDNLGLQFAGVTPANAKTALAALTLHVGSGTYAISAASTDNSIRGLYWTNLEWSDGQTVMLSLTEADSTAPTVVAGSTGYYGDAALSNALTGTQSAGTDIYTKVTFSEDMKQVASNTATARPQLYYRIGTTDTQYDILASGGTLASGDCKPNHATNTNVYVCRYTVAGSDSGAFRVKAGTGSEDKAGNALASAYTHTTSLTLGATAPTTVPAKPAGLTATAGNAQVALSWTNPNDATITKYQYRQKAGSAAWGAWTDISSSAPGETNATSFTVTSLMNGTAYRFRIRAVNAAGESQQSAVAGPVTPVAPAAAVPDVTAIAMGSSPPASPGGWYKWNSVIKVELTFDEIITVSGSPALEITVGSAAKSASCARKSNTGDDRKVLVCSYTVFDLDEDTDGVSVAADKLTLPAGATIKDSDSNDATRTHDALPAQSGHKVDAKGPTLTVGAPTPTGPAKSKSITATAVDSGVGLDATSNSYWFEDAGTTCGPNSLASNLAGLTTFAFGTPVVINSESRNGEYICFKTEDGLDNHSYAKSAEITGIDTTNPGIAFPSGVTPTTGTAATITLTDTGSMVAKYGAIVVVGTKTNANDCNAAAKVGNANLTTVTAPGASVAFSYTPPADSAGKKVCAYVEDAAGNSHASLWGTAIAQARPAKPAGLTATAGNAQVALSWTNPNDATITKHQYLQKTGTAAWPTAWTDIPTSAHGQANAASFTVASLVNGTAYRFRIRAVNAGGNGEQSDIAGPATPAAVDSTGPTVSAVAVTSTVPSGQNGHYRIGDAIAVTVTFDEGIVVTGSPVLKLRVGTAERDATCARKGASGDDAKKLVCSYSVIEGDADADGIAVEAGRLTGTIRDSSDNDATLTYTALGNQGGHKVDGVRPTITGFTGGDSFERWWKGGDELILHVAFSERVIKTGASSLAVKVGANTRTFARSRTPGGELGDEMKMKYRTQTGEEDADGVSVDAGSMTLASGASVKDAAGNAAVLTHSGASAIANLKVDGVKPSVLFPSTGPWLGREARITLTDTLSKVARYAVVEVPGTATDATGCDEPSVPAFMFTGDNFSTTRVSPAASPKTVSYTPSAGSAGKKVCVYVEDAVENIHAALWTTAIAEPPAVPPPAAPEGLRALGSTSNDGTVALNWNELGDGTVTKFQVDWRETGGSGEDWRDIPGSNALTTMHTVEGLENGTEYAFRVRAVNDGGPGAASPVRWASPGRVTVQGITLARFKLEPGEDRLELRWSKLNTFLCGYVIQWRETGTEEWRSRDLETQSRSPKHAITGLKAGTGYDVRLLVNAGTGNGAAGLAWERTRTTTATGDAPPATGPAPALEWARANGAELALRFDAALDESSAPAGSAFAVSVAGAARTVSAVSVSRDTATLTLASAAASGEAVTVGYAPPATGGLRGAGGGDVAAFSGQAAANDTPAPQVRAGLTASVESAPSRHRGKGRFAVRVAFSEAVTAKAKDAGVRVSGGTLVRAARADRRTDLWELRIEPAGLGPVTVTLPATTDCGAAGAVCTADGRRLETALVHAVAGPAPAGLTARVAEAPSEHRGKGGFPLRVAFSEAVTAKARDAGVEVSGGTLVRAARVDKRRDLWELRVAPAGLGAVTVTLPATTDCAASGAVCTADGRRLETALVHAVPGPVALSVADARATEGEDAAIDFAVTLSRAAPGAVTVRYATRNGTAKAGKDYTKAKGTLTFAAGETAKTVSVAVLDDAKDEGEETFRLVLTKPTGAVIADGEAVGTIENDDPVPGAWLARFGRTAASQAVDAIRDRIGAERSPGFSGTFAGQPLPGPEAQPGVPQAAAADGTRSGDDSTTPRVRSASPASPEDGVLALRSFLADAGEGGAGDGPGIRTLAAEDALLGTEFATARDAGSGLSHGIWGRASRSGFSGRDGDTDVEGDVTSVMLGTDWKRKSTLFGVILSRSRGAGTYSGASSGEIDATLTGLVPWAGREVGDSLSVWAALGIGRGEIALTGDDGDTSSAGIGWSMAAAGADGALAPGGTLLGAGLGWHADALATRTTSDAATGLAATSAATTRLRLGVTADWWRTLESGATLGPRLEAGLRHDGGDAETGFGLEIGGGIGFSDPASGLSVILDGRTLALHEDGAFDNWGLSLGLAWDPRPETRRGWSLAAKHGIGGASAGGVDALLGPEAFPGLAGTEAEASWSIEAAHGTGRGNGMVGSPYGRVGGSGDVDALRLGYRIEPDADHAADARVDIWAQPSTNGGDGHEAGAGLEWRW